jgi:hypothetical protein
MRAMADNKTQPTDVTVEQFLATVEPPNRRDEGQRLHELMSAVTGEPGTMWGPSMVGYGVLHYKYASGREGDTMRVGFSPRKAALSLYGIQDHPEAAPLLADLGPHTTGAGCVYVKKLEAVDDTVLRQLVKLAYVRPEGNAS